VAAPEFPARWVMATITNALLKSTKISAMGRNRIDVPKPAIVPTNMDIKAAIKNNNIIINSFIILIWDFFYYKMIIHF